MAGTLSISLQFIYSLPTQDTSTRPQCPRHQGLLGEVHLRDDGGGDLDLRVGLRTVVDGRGRHLRIRRRLAGKAVLSD